MIDSHSQTRRLGLALAASLVLALAGPAGAQQDQAFEEYGVGPRDTAMGNAYTAVAEDWAAAFYNPAGLSQTHGTRLTLGYKHLDPDLTMKIDGFDSREFTDYPSTDWGLFGIATDLQAPSLINPKVTERLTLGLAFALSGFVHSYSNYYDEHTPYFPRYHDRPVSLLSLYVSMGIRITDWLSVGGGIVVAPSITYVDARSRADVYLPEGDFKATQGIVNRAYSVVEPLAGMLVRIPGFGMEDFARVGLTWRDEVRVIDGKGEALNRIVIHAEGTSQTLEPLPPQVVPVITLSGFSPQQIAAGLALRPHPTTLLAADGIWKDWSRWENYFLTRPSPAFEDTFQGRFGVEQRVMTHASWLESFALRAGWYYEPSPAPSQDNEWNILDNDKYVYSLGAGLRLDRVLGIIKTPVDIDAGAQMHDLVPQTIDNSDDPDFPKMETGGRVYTWSAAAKLEW